MECFDLMAGQPGGTTRGVFSPYGWSTWGDHPWSVFTLWLVNLGGPPVECFDLMAGQPGGTTRGVF